MQKIFSNYADLENALNLRLSDPSVRIIGIEGFMLSGKTCFATRLQAGLKIDLLRTDRYAARIDGDAPYSKLINLSQLSKHLEWFIAEESRVMIEGICLREILRSVGKQPDITVYVRRLGSAGWHDGFTFEDFEGGIYLPHCALERSDLEYHKKIRPHERAEYIFERTEL